MLFESHEIYISYKTFMNWLKEGRSAPISSRTKSSSSCDLEGKSRNSFLKLIKALITYVTLIETGQPRPKHFLNRKVILENGRISAEALRMMLQAIDPDTPSRAEQIIKEALG